MPPPFVRQLMSPEALQTHRLLRRRRRCGATTTLIARGQANKVGVFSSMGLSGVLATQLWHHLYMGGGLCELPEHAPRPQVERPPRRRRGIRLSVWTASGRAWRACAGAAR